MEASTSCLNCGNPLSSDSQFCSSCGQKNRKTRVKASEFLKDLLDNLFSWDSKIFRTLLPLFFSPGKLTQLYFEGKQITYVNPLRLFLFFMILNFALLPLVVTDVNIVNSNFNQNLETAINKYEFRDGLWRELDSLSKGNDGMVGLQDLYMEIEQDSVPISDRKLDVKRFGEVSVHQFRFDKYDIQKLRTDSLLSKYEVKSFFDKLVVGQVHKFVKDTKNFGRAYFRRLSGLTFILIPFFALLLKLIYIRRKKYYSEHLVFALHFHAFIFGILSLHHLMFALTPRISISFAIIIPLYLILAIRRFYGQGIFKVLFKTLMLLFGYIFIFALALILITVITFAMF